MRVVLPVIANHSSRRQPARFVCTISARLELPVTERINRHLVFSKAGFGRTNIQRLGTAIYEHMKCEVQLMRSVALAANSNDLYPELVRFGRLRGSLDFVLVVLHHLILRIPVPRRWDLGQQTAVRGRLTGDFHSFR
eukprot:TRINITY_DN16397_c0_g1_i4.p1 TRINITY_DN16397_c0_g1~~TRINITY_DN16397_c0_g1_i4.p1  ORF type:complete len:137 (-),score=7.43 TRINITY_DN16397_c0_g1_i4:261-671(-)